jgi:clan AA aspartic protease
VSEEVVGHVDEQGWPLLPVLIKGARAEVTLEAVIDTGFDGSLCVPVEVAVQLGLELIGFQTVEYADGRRSRELVFLGSVVLAGQERKVEISLTDAQEALVGTELLAHFTLEINFPQKSVRLRSEGGS